jgi:hypothetical protein
MYSQTTKVDLINRRFVSGKLCCALTILCWLGLAHMACAPCIYLLSPMRDMNASTQSRYMFRLSRGSNGLTACDARHRQSITSRRTENVNAKASPVSRGRLSPSGGGRGHMYLPERFSRLSAGHAPQ